MEIKIEYDGAYPNLCRGHLIVYIDGKKWDFGKYCLNSGGGVHRSEDWDMWSTEGEWEVENWPDGFPADRQLRKSVVDCINEQISHGCCGGCI
jgi:hypothetical protein